MDGYYCNTYSGCFHVVYKKHYNSVAIQLRVETEDLKDYNLNKPFTQIIVVPIASLNKAALATLQYARSLSSYVIALNVSTDNKEIDKLKIDGQNLIQIYYSCQNIPLIEQWLPLY